VKIFGGFGQMLTRLPHLSQFSAAFGVHTLVLSGAAAFEAPQMNGSLQTFTADFTNGVINGFRGHVPHESSVQDEPEDLGYDSDDSSEDEDNEATAGLGLQQKKVQFHNI